MTKKTTPEVEETTPEVEETAHKPTIQEHLQDLQQWFDSRGLIPVIVAVGRKSGTFADISDFMPDSHMATLTLRAKHANSTG